LNDETVEQAIRRHERWWAEQETAIQQHTDAMRKHDEAILRLQESREEFWAAMRAATERGDRMDKRLERFEREGRRRLAALAENQASADARIAALADNQVTIQAALQALTAQIDRFLRGQQHDGHQ
jgi:chromosome segregation ATPase